MSDFSFLLNTAGKIVYQIDTFQKAAMMTRKPKELIFHAFYLNKLWKKNCVTIVA
jgi:hypothetical protein